MSSSEVHLNFPGIWNSKRHELLGISLMFKRLETFEHLRVSTGMVHITEKKATYIVHDTLTFFEEVRYYTERLIQACEWHNSLCSSVRKDDCWLQ